MATSDVISLFGGTVPSQEQLAEQYLSGMMVGPGQMAQLSLPQQIVATMRNAGAGLGYSAGRMLGGQTADMIRAQTANQIMQDVSNMQFGSEADMYNELSKRLANAGMAQDAMKARTMALDARRTEQGMQLAQSQDIRAQQELQMRQELHPLNKSKVQLDIEKTTRDMQTVEEQIASEQQKETPNQARLEGLNRQLTEHKEKIDWEKKKLDAQLAHWKAIEAQGASTLSLQRARLDMEQYNKDAVYTITSPNPIDMGKKVAVKVGWLNPKTGKIMGQDGVIYNSAKEAAEAQNIAATLKDTQGSGEGNTNKAGNQPKVDPAQFDRSSPVRPIGQMGSFPEPVPQQMPGESFMDFRQRFQQWDAKRQEFDKQQQNVTNSLAEQERLRRIQEGQSRMANRPLMGQ